MQPARRDLFETFADAITVTHTVAGSPRRAETEAFIRASFARHYGAEVSAFAPHLMLLEQQQRIVAATGWRAAKDDALFLERYLDQPVEQALARLAKQEVRRERIVEVGNLAAEKPGAATAAQARSRSAAKPPGAISIRPETSPVPEVGCQSEPGSANGSSRTSSARSALCVSRSKAPRRAARS